jgi:hypothetical protein
MLNKHLVARIDKPLIADSIVEHRKVHIETGNDAQRGAKCLAALV